MKQTQKSIYVGGKYEKYFDELQELAEKRDRSFSEMLGKATQKYLKGE